MKKLFVHLSMLALLAAMLVPMIGCGHKETEVEETPAATTVESATTTTTTTPMGTDMGTGSTTTESMGTDMGTSTPMGTEMTPPAK